MSCLPTVARTERRWANIAIMKTMSRFVLTLAAVAVITIAPEARQAVSIDTMMATPFPTDLVAAPTGGAIAWVSSNSGVHNILIADPTPGTGPMAGRTDHKWRAVTNYTGDDGLWITEPGFTSDAKTIVYVRGDGANRQGESPNPAQLQDGTDQAVFAVPVAGGTPKRLGPGSGIVASPKGQRVAWVSRGQIWSVDLATTDAPARLVNARGSASGLSWSPDGSMLAFTSGRGTHSYIGVFTLASRELRYIDPSLDRDGNAVWSPDGSRIAWIRQGAAPRARMFSPRREVDEPWSLRVADVKTGMAKQVWKADAGYGSAFQGVVADSQLYWGAGDRLVFPWEKDGWLHLYSVPATGGKATLLTPGNFEVEYVNITPDRARMIYNSNQDDIDKRHIWSVAIDGSSKPARNALKSIGSEWQPVVTSDGTHCGDARRRAGAAARDGDMARRPRALTAREHAAIDLRGDGARGAAAGDDHRDRRHADPCAAVHAEGSEGRREAAGPDLLSRRLPPPDAARLALQLLLPQRLRDESVAREPGLHRAVGELSQRDRLRPGIPRSAQLRRLGRRRVQRRDGRRDST